MTSRILPIEEWNKLGATDFGPVLDQLPKSGGVEVVVVEDEGQIVGAWSLMQIWHAEGLWIAPERRQRTGVARRLWAALCGRVREHGCTSVLTNAMTDDIRHLLGTAGASKMPGDLYLLPLRKSCL